MPVSSKPLRPASMRRRRRAASAPRSTLSYRRTRATIALLIITLGFGLMWFFNGELTARFVVARFAATATTGWAVHLFITILEIAPAAIAPYFGEMPRWFLVAFWAICIPFGVFDVLSSTIGVEPYFLWTGTEGIYKTIQNVLLAEVIGFLPEQMIMLLLVALRSVLMNAK